MGAWSRSSQSSEGAHALSKIAVFLPSRWKGTIFLVDTSFWKVTYLQRFLRIFYSCLANKGTVLNNSDLTEITGTFSRKAWNKTCYTFSVPYYEWRFERLSRSMREILRSHYLISQNKEAVIVCALLLSLWQITFLFPALFSFPFVLTSRKWTNHHKSLENTWRVPTFTPKGTTFPSPSDDGIPVVNHCH